MIHRPQQKQLVEVGTRLTLNIDDVAFGGEGVGRADDFVIFVPFVITGETVEAEVVEVKKQFARARLIRVVKPSPNRVDPVCPYFGQCGGCQYQHVAYPVQLELKRRQVAELLRRIGHLPGEKVDPVVPCPVQYGYRNRIMVRSQWDKSQQRMKVGFLRYDSRLVVDVERCALAEKVLNEQLQEVRAKPPPRGGLKVVLRLAPEGWEVPEHSFFQNNFHLLPKLVEVVRDRVTNGPARWLIDAYCGVGFFSLELAGQVEQFIGVEYDRQAVKAARSNALRRRVSNGEFIEGRTEEVLPELLRRFDPAHTVVLLDPPRTGCARSALDQLRLVRPGQVLYISCHPATLARDLNILCEGDVFELERVVPLDMFPQTQHVECVADVRLKAAAGTGLDTGAEASRQELGKRA